MSKITYSDGTVFTDESTGLDFLRKAARKNPNELIGATVEDVVLEDVGFYHKFVKTTFKNCVFKNVWFGICVFEDVNFIDCSLDGCDTLFEHSGVKIQGKKAKVQKRHIIPPQRSNDEVAKIVGGTVESLPNKEYARVTCECAFCHNKFRQVVKRNSAQPWLKKVPNCDLRVCDSCYKNYELREKEHGNRVYGWRGDLSFYRTPMDAANTAILGLEMEFEGEFYGWKELQDAHQGQLHYGYDTSVSGQNELSWDCGSYSWWKYLSNLKPVCEALKKYGGHAGDTAGIHIHVSRRDTCSDTIAEKINDMCKKGTLKTLMLAVSQRNNADLMNRYASFDADYDEHHAAISYNSHGTVEFRVFNSTLDPKLILQRLAFCKTFFNMVADGKPKDKILESFPNGLKRYIKACADEQLKKKFFTKTEYKKLIEELKMED